MAKDYSKMSDEELLALSGITPPKDYSKMSDEELLALSGKEAPSYSDTWNDSDKVLRKGKRFLRNAATGIASLADLPNLVAMGAHAAGLKDTPQFYESIGDKTRNLIDEYTDNKLKAQNKGEEWEDAITEGLSTGLVGGVKNIAAGAGKAAFKKMATAEGAKQALKSSASNLGSSAAAKAYADNVENPGILGILAASYGGGKAPHFLSNVKGNTKGGMTDYIRAARYKINPQKYDELGLKNFLASDISDSKKVAAKEYDLAKSSNVMDKARNARKEEIAEKFGLSNPENLKESVENIQENLPKEAAEKYHQRFKQSQKERYANSAKDRFAENVTFVNMDQVENELRHHLKGFSPEQLESLPKGKNIFLDALRDLEKEKSVYYKEGLSPEEIKSLGIKNYESESLHNNTPEYMTYKLLENKMENIGDELGKNNASASEQKRLLELYHIFKRQRDSFHEGMGKMNREIPAKEMDVFRKERVGAKNQKNPEDLELRSKPGSGFGKTVDELHNYLEGNILTKKYYDNAHESVKRFKKLNDVANPMKVALESSGNLNVVLGGLKDPKLKQKFFADVMAYLGKRGDDWSEAQAHTKFNKLPQDVKTRLKGLLDSEKRQNFAKTMKYVAENKKKLEQVGNASGSAAAGLRGLDERNLVKGVMSLAKGNVMPLLELFGLTLGKTRAAKIMSDPELLNRMVEAKRNGKSAAFIKSLLSANVAKAARATQSEQRNNKKLKISLPERKAYYQDVAPTWAN
jgi:hypothetical protein